jgi:flagella basal body P-ring formation protein FlgA
MMLAVLAVAAACFPLAGPNITAGDLAKAVPGLAPSDSSLVLAYAPVPGVERILHPAEMRQLLTRLNFDGAMPADDICFARTVAPLTTEAVLAAMHRTLGAEARITVSEISRFPAPAGELVFPREDLGPAAAAVWHGYVRYDGDKKFPVWARVEITVQTTRMIALEQLQPGVPIKASQVSLEKLEGFPDKRTTPASLQQIEGCLPRHFIAAKTPIWSDSFDPPKDILKGDRVTVVVNSGLTRLSFDAEAQNSGRRGDFVSFKNPESGKLFRARVEGPDQASVNTPSLKQ